MRAALGVALIAAVIAVAFLTLALAGVIGAMVARVVAGGDRGEPAGRWAAVGAGSGVVGGQLVAFVAFVGSATLGWSLEGFVLPPICWLGAAMSGAVTSLAALRGVEPPQVG